MRDPPSQQLTTILNIFLLSFPASDFPQGGKRKRFLKKYFYQYPKRLGFVFRRWLFGLGPFRPDSNHHASLYRPFKPDLGRLCRPFLGNRFPPDGGKRSDSRLARGHQIRVVSSFSDLLCVYRGVTVSPRRAQSPLFQPISFRSWPKTVSPREGGKGIPGKLVFTMSGKKPSKHFFGKGPPKFPQWVFENSR